MRDRQAETAVAGVSGQAASDVDAVLQFVLDWIASDTAEELQASVVPGTTGPERARLTSLGRLVRSALTPASAASHWPQGVCEWLGEGAEAPPEVVNSARAVVGSNSGPQFLASVYESIVRADHRRPLGTFFTPPEVVGDILATWEGSEGPPSTVVDIGAGVGAFTLEALTRWPEAAVYAIDVNPVTLGLLGWLAIEHGLGVHPAGETRPGLHLVLEDFITWSASSPDLPSPMVVLGNPPYTRLQLLAHEDRARLVEQLGELVGSRASLSTWMLAQAIRMIGPADGVALLLPAHWLEAQYADRLRSELWNDRSRAVHLDLLGADVFPDARIDAVALSIGVAGREASAPFTVRHGDAIENLDRSGPCPPRLRARQLAAAGNGRLLGELARARRGTATGANSFFLLSERDRLAAGLGQEVLAPLLRRLAGVGNRVSRNSLANLPDDVVRWILVATAEDRSTNASVRSLLAQGETDGVANGELCSRRSVWHDLRHDLVRPDVVIGAITRGTFAVVEADGEVAITNNLYGLWWSPDVQPATQTRIVAWLRSAEGQAELRGIARNHGHGLLKLEPSALRSLRIPHAVLDRGGKATAKQRDR